MDAEISQSLFDPESHLYALWDKNGAIQSID